MLDINVITHSGLIFADKAPVTLLPDYYSVWFESLPHICWVEELRPCYPPETPVKAIIIAVVLAAYRTFWANTVVQAYFFICWLAAGVSLKIGSDFEISECELAIKAMNTGSWINGWFVSSAV